nr:hypothetical protein CFP56_67069 [Quercus suber]
MYSIRLTRMRSPKEERKKGVGEQLQSWRSRVLSNDVLIADVLEVTAPKVVMYASNHTLLNFSFIPFVLLGSAQCQGMIIRSCVAQRTTRLPSCVRRFHPSSPQRVEAGLQNHYETLELSIDAAPGDIKK